MRDSLTFISEASGWNEGCEDMVRGKFRTTEVKVHTPCTPHNFVKSVSVCGLLCSSKTCKLWYELMIFILKNIVPPFFYQTSNILHDWWSTRHLSNLMTTSPRKPLLGLGCCSWGSGRLWPLQGSMVHLCGSIYYGILPGCLSVDAGLTLQLLWS